MIVVTDGGQGAWCYNGSVFFKIGVTEDKRVDATGAGDAFASSLSAKIILSSSGKGQSYLPPKDVIEQALKWGIIVSGSVVNHVGAHEGILSIDQIEEREIKLVKLNPEIYTK
jgi:sugar/nucleoside kinase (ribokinase family)